MATEDDPPSPEPTDSPLTNASGPDPRRNLGTHRRIGHELWDSMYQAWKAGERSPKHLGLRFGVSEDSAHRYITKGVPARGWDSFHNRRTMETSAVEMAKADAAKRMSDQLVDEYGKARRENLDTMRAVRVAAGQVLSKLFEAIKVMPMTTPQVVLEVVVDKEGAATQVRRTIERPVDVTQVAPMARAVSSAIALASRMESIWLGGPADPSAVPEGEKLTAAEIEYIEQNDGALPPGVSPEAFLAKMAATYGVKLGVKATN
jgi:hypothetical protein